VVDSYDVEVVKKIKQNEVELRDRNTVLPGTKANVRKGLTKESFDRLTVFSMMTELLCCTNDIR
jgi:parafibromin